MTFDIIYNIGDCLEASLIGDLDINTVEEFKDSLINKFKEEDNDLIINLESLDYIDSTGLGAFMTIYKEVEDRGKKLKIINPKKNILKLFKITELDTILNLED